ncbi:ribonuclease H-like domain-containing protein, partial [Melampsora americana]
FLHNKSFLEFQQKLSVLPFTPPSQYVMMDTVLTQLHACYSVSAKAELKQNTDMTISLDGWTNCSRTVLLLCGTRMKKLIDILDLDEVQHTSDDTLAALKIALHGQDVSWEQIGAIVTDSPSLMVKLRRLVQEEYPHVIPLACCLHVFNLIIKKSLDHLDMKDTATNYQAIFNFFSSSHFWGNQLFKWRMKEGISHGLWTFCSMLKVALLVESHERGFQMCLSMLKDKSISTPTINKTIKLIIENCDHFTSNSILVKLLQPVIDALSRLEQAKTSVGDIWKEFQYYPRFLSYKAHCLHVLNTQAKIFNQPIYIVGFFLNPTYSQVAVLRAYPIDKMIKFILPIAKMWSYKKSKALSLKSQVIHYLSGEGLFQSTGTVSVAIDYWLAIPSTSHTSILKWFTIRVLELVAHAAGVESVFSMMGATKTKTRSWMTVTNLKTTSQIKLQI